MMGVSTEVREVHAGKKEGDLTVGRSITRTLCMDAAEPNCFLQHDNLKQDEAKHSEKVEWRTTLSVLGILTAPVSATGCISAVFGFSDENYLRKRNEATRKDI